jgi:hypothetical protein
MEDCGKGHCEHGSWRLVGRVCGTCLDAICGALVLCRDIYIPKDYYSGEPRGIGFLEYANPRDAEDAMFGLDRKVLDGKEVSREGWGALGKCTLGRCTPAA